jgi:hypothetical protein
VIACDAQAAIWDADTRDKLVIFATPGSAQMTEIAWSPERRRVVTSARTGNFDCEPLVRCFVKRRQ